MDTKPVSNARLLAIRIGKIVNIGPDTHMMMFRELEQIIQAGLNDAQEEGKRDGVIEFCEGDKSKLAELEHLAYEMGYANGKRPGDVAYFDWNKKITNEAKKEAYEDAAKIAEDIMLSPVCNDPAHDNRWCSRCEAMKDCADVIMEKLRERAKDTGGINGNVT